MPLLLNHKFSVYHYVRLFLVTLFLSLTPVAVYACSCGPIPLVLDEFSRSDEILVGKVVSINKIEPDYQNYPSGIKSADFLITRTYKGNVKPGTTIEIENGNGVFCVWTFNEKSVGDEMLLYSPKGNDRRYLSTCSRSAHIEYAGIDLLYLDRLSEVKGKTRVSGRISYEYAPTSLIGKKVLSKKVRIVGRGRKFTLTADSNGVYETYGLPPGRYYIAPEIEPGWKIYRSSLQFAPDAPYFFEYPYSPEDVTDNRYFFLVKAGGHTQIDFKYSIDNSIRGKILGPNGMPFSNLCINAVETNRTDLKSYGPYACTDQKGDFKIERLYDSRYILVINGDYDIEARRPVPTTFYPGVRDRSEATVLENGPGRKIVLKPFRLPEVLPTILLHSKVTFSDGNAFEDVNIQFIADKADTGLESRPYVRSDKTGKFDLRIFKGQTGKLRAEKIIRASMLERCAGLRNAVVSENSGGSLTIATSWLPINAEGNVNNLELLFAFPSCSID